MKKEYICEVCGKEYNSYNKNTKYCSQKCYKTIPNVMKGRKREDLTKFNLSRKGKTWDELYGVEKATQLRKLQSEKTLERIAKGSQILMNIDKSGPKNGNWKGGVSKEGYSYKFNDKLKEEIRKRDNYKCKICHLSQKELFQSLSIHHIDYNKKNYDKNNLISLCPSCHSKTNNNRKYWKEYFGREFGIKKEFVSWIEIEERCKLISEFLKDKNITGIVPIPRGGIVPAVILSNISGIQLKEKVELITDLLIDEIVDFGETFKRYKKEYPENLFVCLDFNKSHYKFKTLPDFYVREVKDWIVYPWEKNQK